MHADVGRSAIDEPGDDRRGRVPRAVEGEGERGVAVQRQRYEHDDVLRGDDRKGREHGRADQRQRRRVRVQREIEAEWGKQHRREEEALAGARQRFTHPPLMRNEHRAVADGLAGERG